MNLGNIMGDLKFGKADSRQFKLSMNGIAVRSADNKFNVYDEKTGTLIDVAGMTFDFDALYVMPSNEVVKGDIILHAGFPVFITSVEDGKVEGVKYLDRTIIRIPATKNIFGFNFYSKVISLFGDMGASSADEANPFGAMFSNPMMMMMMMGDKGSGNGSSMFGGDMMEMMMMSQMMGGGQGFNMFGAPAAKK